MIKVYYDAVLGCTGWDFRKLKNEQLSKKRKTKPIIPILVLFSMILVILLSTKPQIMGILSSTKRRMSACIENLLITIPVIEINISIAGNIEKMEQKAIEDANIWHPSLINLLKRRYRYLYIFFSTLIIYPLVRLKLLFVVFHILHNFFYFLFFPLFTREF